MFFLAPSILSADFTNLKRDIDLSISAGASYIHIDVMDGHFVNNITIGPVVLKSIMKQNFTAKSDVHLMITNPDMYLDAFINEKPHIITVHLESDGDTLAQVHKIKSAGILAGVSIKPNTPISQIESLLPILDLVLVMSVEPGFGGQGYIPSSTAKIRELRKMICQKNLNTLIEVDGGIHKNNISEVALAGADILVAGSAVFNGDIYQNTIELIQNLNNGVYND